MIAQITSIGVTLTCAIRKQRGYHHLIARANIGFLMGSHFSNLLKCMDHTFWFQNYMKLRQFGAFSPSFYICISKSCNIEQKKINKILQLYRVNGE